MWFKDGYRKIMLLLAAYCVATGLQFADAEIRVVRAFSTARTAGHVTGITWHPHRKSLFVVAGDQFVHEISSRGRQLARFAVTSTGNPAATPTLDGIDVLPEGNLLIVDSSLGRAFVVLPPEGEAPSRILGEKLLSAAGSPAGIAYVRSGREEKDGRVYCLNGETPSVQRYLADGLISEQAFKLPDEGSYRGIQFAEPDVYWLLHQAGLAAKLELVRDNRLRVLLPDLVTLTGYSDAEGLGLDRDNRILYISFAHEKAVVALDVSDWLQPVASSDKP